MNRNIEENIACYTTESKLNFKNLKLASKVAEVEPFVSNLSREYKTYIGEDGKLLSGGQKQRIAIARAIYKKPQVLFLDEATSSLDFETEQKIIDNILNLMPDLTVIMVTHKSSIAKRFQYVFKIKDS